MTPLQQLHENGDREFDKIMLNTEVRLVRDGASIYDTSGETLKSFIHQEREKAYKAGIDMAVNIVKNEMNKTVHMTHEEFINRDDLAIKIIKALKGEK